MELDQSDRLLLSGLGKLGLGVVLIAGLETVVLTGGATAVVGAGLLAASAIAVAPGLVVLGLMATTMPKSEVAQWFAAAGKVNEAVTWTHNPVMSAADYAQDEALKALKKALAADEFQEPSVADVNVDPETTGRPPFRDVAKTWAAESLANVTDDLLENDVTPRADVAVPRAPGDVSDVKAPGVEHPMCRPIRTYDFLQEAGVPREPKNRCEIDEAPVRLP